MLIFSLTEYANLRIPENRLTDSVVRPLAYGLKVTKCSAKYSIHSLNVSKKPHPSMRTLAYFVN